LACRDKLKESLIKLIISCISVSPRSGRKRKAWGEAERNPRWGDQNLPMHNLIRVSWSLSDIFLKVTHYLVNEHFDFSDKLLPRNNPHPTS